MTDVPARAAYRRLVEQRKDCRRCSRLVNPSEVDGGQWDSDEISPWTRWQGAIPAPLMVVGQDWGDVGYFRRHKGREEDRNPTNAALRKLLDSVGFSIEGPETREQPQQVFFTNAILCLKMDGGLQGEVQASWFANCGSFLQAQIEIVRPRVVVALGERAYKAVMEAHGIRRPLFREAVLEHDWITLNKGTRLVPVYHCGARIQNTHRPLEQQIEDWHRVNRALSQAGGDS